MSHLRSVPGFELTSYDGGGIDFDRWDPCAGGMFIHAREGIGHFQLNLGNSAGSGGWSVALSAAQLLDLSTACQKSAAAVLAHERAQLERDADGET